MESENKTKKTKKGPILLALLIPVLVGVGVIAGLYFSPMIGQTQTDTAAEELPEEASVPLEEFLVNLNPSSGRTSYVRMEISLATRHEDGVEIIENNLPHIRDTIIYATTRKTKESLFDDEGTLIIKEIIQEDVNKNLSTEVISDVYVTNFIVQ